jgi:excisionase family DNA binding protein
MNIKAGLTVRQAAQESGYSQEYIRQLCREGKLEYDRVGTAYLINPDSLKGYVEAMRSLGSSKHDPNRQ